MLLATTDIIATARHDGKGHDGKGSRGIDEATHIGRGSEGLFSGVMLVISRC